MTFRFLGDERGSLTVFSLLLFLAMFVLGGLAVDMLVFESHRAHLQNVTDRASLAAADMEQTLDANEVVQSYFEKEGLDASLEDVIVTDNGVSKSVEVQSGQSVKTMFMRFVGATDLAAPARAKATEAVGSVEVSLVLDNSGSMGSTDGGRTSRLENLKLAVQTFLDIMYPNGADPNVTVSIVPYSTQVNIGPDLASILDVTDEHEYSHCVDFESSAFSTLALDTEATYQRSGHFDMFYNTDEPFYWKCRPEESQHVYVMGSDPDEIMTRVNALVASGQTSLHIGAKWGAALLDPSANGIVKALVGNPNSGVLAQHVNRPTAYGDPDTVKALVLMTDGINTSHNNLAPAYKSGDSNLYRRQGSLTDVLGSALGLVARLDLLDLLTLGIDTLTPHDIYTLQLSEIGDEDGDGIPNEGWWTPELRIGGVTIWDAQFVDSVLLGGGGDDGRLSYVELWNDMSPAYYAETFVRGPRNDRSARDAFLASALISVDGATKDSQLRSLCDQAKLEGLTIYTVGLSVNDHAEDLLTDCASNENFFLDTSSDDLVEAFEAIAASIVNQKLRLTQ